MSTSSNALTPRADSRVSPAPAPYTVSNDEAIKIKDANGDTIASMFLVHLRGRRDEREVQATARLFAAAPLLEIIANATGLYMWESLSDAFHQNLTQQRKAELLAAFRAFAGYRDGRLTMEQACAEIAPLAKATEA